MIVDTRDAPVPKARAGLERDGAQRHAASAAQAEGLADGLGADDEVVLDGDECDVSDVPREVVQRERRLECGDAAAGEHDARGGGGARMRLGRHTSSIASQSNGPSGPCRRSPCGDYGGRPAG